MGKLLIFHLRVTNSKLKEKNYFESVTKRLNFYFSTFELVIGKMKEQNPGLEL